MSVSHGTVDRSGYRGASEVLGRNMKPSELSSSSGGGTHIGSGVTEVRGASYTYAQI